eukprot:7972254-Prorocentrum_lima.AAC.1
MTSSLVGSEMCIRDRKAAASKLAIRLLELDQDEASMLQLIADSTPSRTCLLYTSDAADDM